jgi:N-hydroxyarylamine O-acetyltransferase
MIDLDAYFGRIGYTGPRTPDLATLRAIHALHPAAIPFENLDPLLGRPVPLDVTVLQRKMVGSRRGGYCFEQNTLLKAVLEALGFTVSCFAARVLWKTPPDRPPNPRAHMVLKVDLDDDAWLADVGFGGYLFAAPLLLVPDVEQPTPSGTFRLLRTDFTCTLQLKLAAAWQDVYRFALEPQFPIDVEVANWFTSTHPNSRFRNNLLIERLTPLARISLFNTRLTRRHADGKVEEIVLTTPDGLGYALAAEFQLEAPADLATLFARLPPPHLP